MSEKPFISGALEVNLAETRTARIEIPESHLSIISLTNEHFGIHSRTLGFFKELHHPYANRAFIGGELRKILMGDLWLYLRSDKGIEALSEYISLAGKLIINHSDFLTAGLLIRSLLEFVPLVLKQGHACSVQLTGRVISELFTIWHKQPGLLIEHSSLIRKNLIIPDLPGDLSSEANGLLLAVAIENLAFWELHTGTEAWIKNRKRIFSREYPELSQLAGKSFFADQRALIENFKASNVLPGGILLYSDMAAHLRNAINHFDSSLDAFYYLMFLLHHPGMAGLTSSLLWDLNKVLRHIHSELREEDMYGFLDNIFELFDELRDKYMSVVLDCILTLGKEVMGFKNKKAISYFENKVIQFGFSAPGSIYVKDNWQLTVDPNHVKNIRVWLELIEHAPYTFRKLLSALVINLRLGGIFIFDTDLFQRDISKLLNSDITPLYKQIKQLTRIFPVYFNEIGAEGELRDVTTEMDELSSREDRLIHFLRKQVHTEGNNAHINLARLIFQYWYDGNPSELERMLPSDVAKCLDTESKWYIGVNRLLNDLCTRSYCQPNEILMMSQDRFNELLNQAKDFKETDRKRLGLMFRLYFLLREKYSFDTTDIASRLRKHGFFDEAGIAEIDGLLRNKSYEEAIERIFACIEKLNGIIFDPAYSKGWESIYHKRHIAFGIPSMYGQYRESKFEALGLIFRLERLVSGLMEQLMFDYRTEYLTARALNNSYRMLTLFCKGLRLDGISSQGLESNLQMLRYGLTSESFSLGQFVNLFQFMAKNVADITNTYFFGFYDQPLRMIIPKLFDPGNSLSSVESSQLLTNKSETFYRELLSSSFLIQLLDAFIARMINLLQGMMDNIPSDLIRHIMSYDSGLVASPLYSETPRMDNQIFLGSKAFFQKKLLLDGFPVPKGFVLSTEVFRRRRAILSSPGLSSEIDALISEQIQLLERACGRSFGVPDNPLLLSVRSGTAISMPGAMNTFLNVGMNDEITSAIGRKKGMGWTSWDCYRRLIQTWGMTHGISRDAFDQIMISFKETYGVGQKIQFSASQMKQMAFAYKSLLHQQGIHLPEDPFDQLRQAIMAVFDSWDSERARVYRDHLKISDEWGTAVVIQQMVLGNLSNSSGTGVVFTHNHLIQKPGIYLNGDFTLCSQGEDIVAGLVHAQPVSKLQKQLTARESQLSLEETLPGIYSELLRIAKELTDGKGYGHQEIEFTFESDNPADLYILQIRDQDTQKMDKIRVFSSSGRNMKLLGRGLGGGGGALNGRLAIGMHDIEKIRRKYPGDACILLRPDTVPDDIPILFECEGLVTARGGTTSHAAVTAARLGKACVLNCPQLMVNEKEGLCTINGITLKPGNKIAIDGFSGNIYAGHYPTTYTEVIA